MIINPKNLRLGNLLRDKLTGAILAVSELVKEYEGGSEMVSFYVVDRSMFPLPDGWQVEPIPLTPEILDKIGSLIENRDRYYFKDSGFFDKTNENYTFLESTPMIMQPGEDPDKTWINVLVGVGRGHTEIYIASLLYVHQLQNIYYDIFQKELSVEL